MTEGLDLRTVDLIAERVAHRLENPPEEPRLSAVEHIVLDIIRLLDQVIRDDKQARKEVL